MSYVYAKVDKLEKTAKVGSGQCAVLVQWYAKVPLMKYWTAGDLVRGNATIKKGTAVATFVNGEYPPAKGHHGHAAFYVSQDSLGVTVMDQWDSATKPKVSSRKMSFKGTTKAGDFVDIQNNGDALYVIEATTP